MTPIIFVIDVTLVHVSPFAAIRQMDGTMREREGISTKIKLKAILAHVL
jgi:hypothetical protein